MIHSITAPINAASRGQYKPPTVENIAAVPDDVLISSFAEMLSDMMRDCAEELLAELEEAELEAELEEVEP